jgi:DNA-binding transcriptional LysR family regulator
VLEELRSAEDALSVGAKNAAGRLIVTAPTAFGRKHIAPHLPAFLAAHPNLAVQIHLSERVVDLKNERFDLAIRIADLKSADLVAVKLARNHRVVCASPAYLKRAGRPRVLADLARHNCLVTSTEDGVTDSWPFSDHGKAVAVKVSGNLQCNDGEVLTRWALAGEGLAMRSAWEVSEEIKKERLVSVLDEFAVPGHNIYAVFPERRLLPAKVRFFIDHLKKAFGDPPYWE